jgi:hypothetical protein
MKSRELQYPVQQVVQLPKKWTMFKSGKLLGRVLAGQSVESIIGGQIAGAAQARTERRRQTVRRF